MATDTGKHSALRQTSDGSFEIVYETGGFHEVVEDEASFAESTTAEPPRVPRQPLSRRSIVMAMVGALALIVTVAVVAFVASDRGSTLGESAEGLPVVPGFKPYGGGGDARAAVNRSRTPSPAAARAAVAAAEAEDAREAAEAVVEEEVIAESEQGWEVQEIPPTDDIVVEEEVIEEQGVEELAEEGSDGEVPVDPRTLRTPRDFAPRGIGRPIESDRMPNAALPSLSGRSMVQDRLNRLPIRQLQPNNEAEELPLEDGQAIDELPAEDVPADELEVEVVEEEIVEDY